MLNFGSKIHSGISRRRDERYVAQELTCAIGPLMDLSASGMRIRTNGKPQVSEGHSQNFVLRSASQAIHVTGRVQRIRRVDLLGRQYDLGIEFLDVCPAKRAAIAQLAQYGFIAAGKHRGEADHKPAAATVTAEMEVEDLYALLGVDRTATNEQIHAAYRRAARDCHPDVSDAPDAAERFAELAKVYKVLSDEAARKRYDALLRTSKVAA